MKSHRLPGYNCTLKICLTTPIGLYFWLFILKNRKLAFHWGWIFAFVSLRPWLRYLNITHGVFWLFIYLFIFRNWNAKFSRWCLASTGNSCIHLFFLIIDLSRYSSQIISPCPTVPLNYPNIVTFHLVSGDLLDGNDKNILLKNAI